MRIHIGNSWYTICYVMYSKKKKMLVNTASGFECQMLIIQFKPHCVSHKFDLWACSTHEISLKVLQNHIHINHLHLSPFFVLLFYVNLKSSYFFFYFFSFIFVSGGHQRLVFIKQNKQKKLL